MTTATETPTETRKPTADEMDAILLLVRGGWLKLELAAVPEQRSGLGR